MAVDLIHQARALFDAYGTDDVYVAGSLRSLAVSWLSCSRNYRVMFHTGSDYDEFLANVRALEDLTDPSMVNETTKIFRPILLLVLGATSTELDTIIENQQILISDDTLCVPQQVDSDFTRDSLEYIGRLYTQIIPTMLKVAWGYPQLRGATNPSRFKSTFRLLMRNYYREHNRSLASLAQRSLYHH